MSRTESGVTFRELRQTCSACPSQWEGITTEGEGFYARYRWGHLTWGFGATIDAAVSDSLKHPGIQLGDGLDGTLSEYAMLAEVQR